MLPASLLRRTPSLLAFLALSVSLQAQGTPAFEPTWDSLNRHLAGSWFSSARFGIAVQWGVASVPGQSRDYARLMYIPPEPATPNPIWTYHEKHYGHPSEFGYKDLLPYFEAKAWNPVELAKVFKSTGAGYVVVLGTDRDNIDLFDSTFHDWNSQRFGPHRNLAREWADALRAEDLKVGVTLANGRAWDFLRPAQGAEWEGPKADKPFDGLLSANDGGSEWWAGLDPRDLYGRPRPGNAFAPLPARPSSGPSGPDRVYQETWYKRAAELVSQTKPDILSVEGGLPHGEWGLRLAAHFFSNTGNGRRDMVRGSILILPPVDNAAPRAFVAASQRALPGRQWQAEIDVARDGIRTDTAPAADARAVLARLAEVASAGGNLLVRIALRPEGTLPEDQAKVLSDIGGWMADHRSAILNTRPGPVVKIANTARVVPATRSEQRVFLFFPSWPGRSQLRLEGFAKPVRELKWSDGKPVDFRHEAGVLTLQTPAQAPDARLSFLELVDDEGGVVD